MPRGITPRQPSRSGRHDKSAAIPPRGKGPMARRVSPVLKKVGKVAAPIAGATAGREESAAGKSAGKAPKGYNPVAHARVNEILKRLDERYPGGNLRPASQERLGAAGGDYPLGAVHRRARQHGHADHLRQVPDT